MLYGDSRTTVCIALVLGDIFISTAVHSLHSELVFFRPLEENQFELATSDTCFVQRLHSDEQLLWHVSIRYIWTLPDVDSEDCLWVDQCRIISFCIGLLSKLHGRCNDSSITQMYYVRSRGGITPSPLITHRDLPPQCTAHVKRKCQSFYVLRM